MKSYLSFCFTVVVPCSIFIIFPKITYAIPLPNSDTILVTAKMWSVKASLLDKSNNGFDFEKNMPWIAALSIGFLTVFANLYVSNRLRTSNLVVVEKQINNAQAIAIDQIQQSRRNSERDFNKTVISGARQIWINNLRDIVSDILALSSKFSMYQTISNDDANEIRLQIAKAELMLIASEYGGLLEIVKELEHCCKDIQIGNQSYECIDEILSRLKAQASIVLKEEWQKIKSGS